MDGRLDASDLDYMGGRIGHGKDMRISIELWTIINLFNWKNVNVIKFMRFDDFRKNVANFNGLLKFELLKNENRKTRVRHWKNYETTGSWKSAEKVLKVRLDSMPTCSMKVINSLMRSKWPQKLQLSRSGCVYFDFWTWSWGSFLQRFSLDWRTPFCQGSINATVHDSFNFNLDENF